MTPPTPPSFAPLITVNTDPVAGSSIDFKPTAFFCLSRANDEGIVTNTCFELETFAVNAKFHELIFGLCSIGDYVELDFFEREINLKNATFWYFFRVDESPNAVVGETLTYFISLKLTCHDEIIE